MREGTGEGHFILKLRGIIKINAFSRCFKKHMAIDVWITPEMKRGTCSAAVGAKERRKLVWAEG